MRRWAPLLLAGAASAAPPALDWLHPVEVGIGAETEVEAGGKLEPWPVEMWCDAEGVEFVPREKAGRYLVRVASNAAPGVCVVRAHNAEDASDPRMLVLGRGPRTLEVEPNGAMDEAQRLTNFPVTVQGRLQKSGDVDRYRLDLRRGQRLRASLLCHRLDAPVDPLMLLTGSNGYTLAFNHDGLGTALDPELHYLAAEDGPVFAQVSGFKFPPSASVSFGGAAQAVYSLRFDEVAPGPPPDFAPGAAATTLVAGARWDGFLPATFRLAGAKGDHWRLRMRAAELGADVDGVFRIVNTAGKEVASADDRSKHWPDPLLAWQVPADGEYTVEGFDRLGRSGSNQWARVEAEKVGPGWELSTVVHRLVLEPGSETALEVEAKRQGGFTGAVRVIAEGLPAGVETTAPTFPEKDGKINLTFLVAADAKSWRGPVRLAAIAADGESGRRDGVVSLKGRTTDPEDVAVRRIDSVWLTIAAVKEEDAESRTE